MELTVVSLFRKAFGCDPNIGASAPGRVNLIGEHTDYCDGFVFPMALERCTYLAGRKTGGAICRVITDANGSTDLVEFSPLRKDLLQGEPFWCNYIKGVLAQFDVEIPAFDMAISTTVPIGGGLSSSAALEVAVYTFVQQLLGYPVSNTLAKAKACQKAEQDFANMPCGIMDQYISTFGHPGAAVLIDCRSYESKIVHIKDPNVVVFIANSNVTHKLSDSEYPKRKASCEEAVKALTVAYGIKSLRDADMAALEGVRSAISDETFRRARHVITETKRCADAVNAFLMEDYKKFGELMVQSHTSLRDDYEVSCPELDSLVTLALEVEGVFGSRMTGGGFGGCTVTVALESCQAALVDHIVKGYPQATYFFTRPGGGARAWDVAPFL